jgi:hypothetical protein
MKLQTLLYISLYFLLFPSCDVIKGPEMQFDPSLQNALFSADYQPNTEGKLCTQGYYLPYDADCDKFRSGKGFCISDNGLVTIVRFCETLIPRDSFSIDKMDEYIESDDYFLYNSASEGGIYIISGDTLIIDQYDNIYATFHDYWGLTTIKYKIIDNEILEEIPTVSDEKDKLQLEFCGPRVYRFVPATKFQNEFYMRIKNTKWMWKNEEDWKAYKKARNEYKKTHWLPY